MSSRSAARAKPEGDSKRRAIILGASLDERFAEYHRLNPQIYKTLVGLARRAKAKGRAKCGIKMLYEVARWHFYLEATSDEEWALNNSYTSRYGRLIMDSEPDLADFFETRVLRSRELW